MGKLRHNASTSVTPPTETSTLQNLLEDQPLTEHLVELRQRLIYICLALLVFFIPLATFSSTLFDFMSSQFREYLPEGEKLIGVGVFTPFFTPLKMAFSFSLFLAAPVILYQLWGFIAPGLYQTEKKFARPLLVSSILLFYCGAAFAFYVVMPLVFSFLVTIAPESMQVAPDIAEYQGFIVTMFLAFGAAFEIPVATVLLVKMGITTPEVLVSKRAYVLLGAFVVGMFLTPPDIFSQTLLAIPMYLLFEVGIIMSRVMVKPEDVLESNASHEGN